MPFQASAAILAVYPKLNGTSAADILYWSDAELYQWADEAERSYARRFGGFVERDTGRSTAAGAAQYAVPERHVATRHVSVAATALRVISVAELDSRDEGWATESGTPRNWTLGAAGIDYYVLYPAPVGVDPLDIVYWTYPETISAGSMVAGPAALQDYLTYAVLAEARKKDGEGAMPEVPPQLAHLVAVYEAACKAYFGESH